MGYNRPRDIGRRSARAAGAPMSAGATSVPKRTTRLSLLGVLVFCGLSGLLLSLSFPPAGLWPVVWVALVPWIVAVRSGSRFSTFAGSWLAGFVFFAALLYWLHLFGLSVWLIAALAWGAIFMLWGLLLRWTGRLEPLQRMLGAAAVWCGLESLRGLGEFAFTWGWLGYSLSPSLSLLPLAHLLGTIGLSFIIVLVNAGLAEIVVSVLRREAVLGTFFRGALVCGAAALALVGAGSWFDRLPGPSGPAITVAVVQGSAHGPLTTDDVNRPLTREEQVQMLDVYQSLTRQAARERPALIVWPESAIPGSPGDNPWITERMAELVSDSGAWLLAGGHYVDEEGRTYNSAYLYSPTGNVTRRYDKVRLVPFGEYVPARARLPFIARYPVRDFDFAAGPVHHPLQAGTVTIGPTICFESIFPDVAEKLVADGAQVLVVITNDAWFGRTAAAAQHRQIAVLRAVETGRWVVRAASTGISSLIAPDGRIVAEAGLYQRKVLSAEITLTRPEEPGARWSRPFAWLMIGLSIAYLIAPAAVPRRRRRARAARRETPREPPDS